MDKYNFNKLFADAKGQPVFYKERRIFLSDKVEVKYDEKLMITIEKTNSKYIQGIGISGDIEIFGEKYKKAVIFENVSLPPIERTGKRNSLPYTFEITCKKKDGVLSIYNVAEVDGRQDWFNYGCAMITEEIVNGKRYYCNDFQPNDDFNDIVFSVVKI